MDGHPHARGEGGLALWAGGGRCCGSGWRDAEGGVEPVDGLLAGLEAFLASRKLGGLIVIEVNPDHEPRGELARLVDGLVAALARQRPARSELRTIRS